MALLQLRDIGKIYVSDGNVAVGIRGVNLSFDRGEFVAITGKSGSGKSTLLNVISGMDSYEEGELLIEGSPTSHYLQPDWEEYREKYISFIFQDYNIIESFTVLQNVELALMHIEDKKERRRRALELIERVGLSSHIKHKGSKLSGGQKQRTVIARALAKDSPIILADEPTGNLDSVTSKEIIELLREVSKDKLLIVVTHNFEQVQDVVTRHIRVFDGSVESDHVIKRAEPVPAADARPEPKLEIQGKKTKGRAIKNGVTLGKSIFTSKPRLSAFLCILLTIGTLGIFVVTSFCGSAADIFKKHYIFEPIEGRLVIAKRSGEVISDDELNALKKEYNAERVLHYDILLDAATNNYVNYRIGDRVYSFRVRPSYNDQLGVPDVGRYPESDGEALLYLPIHYQDEFGKDELILDEISYNGLHLDVSGVKYYYDNTKLPILLFTEGGFKVATANHYVGRNAVNASISLIRKKAGSESVIDRMHISQIDLSFNVEQNKIYVDSNQYRQFTANGEFETRISLNSNYYKHNFDYYDGSEEMSFSKTFDNSYVTKTKPSEETVQYIFGNDRLIVHPQVVVDMADEVLSESYTQASLFFESDKEAEAVAKALKEKGYIAVPANTTYSPGFEEVILSMLQCAMLALVWVITIVFLAFFINLCTARTLGAFKGDMAIMRSMGISVKVIRIGMYVRMLISLIPAFIVMIISAVGIFTSPSLSEYFQYLQLWQYGLIIVGMIMLTVRITHKQIRKLFRESVKKSLRGGAAE